MADNSIRPLEPERSTAIVGDKNIELQEGQNDDAASVHSASSSIQAGVQKAMILKKSWSRTSLAIAFSRYVLLCLAAASTNRLRAYSSPRSPSPSLTTLDLF